MRVVRGGFQDPAREVGRAHIASAQDRGDARPGARSGSSTTAAMPSAADGSTTRSRMLIERPHAGHDRVLAHEYHVVDHDEQVVQHLRNRTATGDAIGDRLDAVGLDHLSLTPRQRHRGRTEGLDSDHLHVPGERAHDVANAAGHRPATEGYEYDVEPRIVSDELEPDCNCAFAPGQVQAVPDEVRAVRFRDLSHDQPGVFDVLAFEPDGGAEGGDLTQLERVGGSRRHDGDREAPKRAAVGQRLPETAGAHVTVAGELERVTRTYRLTAGWLWASE
jgi:hypothetical protein